MSGPPISLLDVMKIPPSGDPTTAVLQNLVPRNVEDVGCDVLVVGGGTGGVAAALAAVRAGRTVCLLEETDWIGGQLTAQGVSALDEHDHIERFGGTRTYYALREAIREHYRRLSPALAAQPQPNPGACWVTRLAFEPRVALGVLESWVEPFVASGRLRIFRRTKTAAVETTGDRITRLHAVHLDERRWWTFHPSIVIDATELGDVLPLAGAEYWVGAESQAQTREPHAQPHQPKAHCVQSFTYTFVLERAPAGSRHVIACPERYEQYRDDQPYGLRIFVHGGEIYGEETRWLDYQIFERAEGTKGGLWTYRRLIDCTLFPGVHDADLSLINWPGNDYRDVSIIDRPPREQAHALQNAKRVSLGFLYWLQTEAPGPDGARGAPELRLRPDIPGTVDGLSKFPYIRESRRLRALMTVLEQDVSADHQRGARARHFADSVGVGWYPIDIHRAGDDDVGVSCHTRPFQIPMGALIPVRLRNLLAGAKNLGVTHITNGSYRLHPVEWNTGEAAGALAAFALQVKRDPAAVWRDPVARIELQRRLAEQGIPLYWFTDVGVEHPAFVDLQMAAVTGAVTGAPDNLEAAALSPAVRGQYGL
jgi:FAD dependent oxidoreductase